MKITKEHLEYLKKRLMESELQYLETEVAYNTMTALVMGSLKNNKGVLEAQTKMKFSKEELSVRIRQYQSILEKLKEGDNVA